MTDGEIRGPCPSRFAEVRAAFAANFADDLELGARFCLAVEGEIVVDLLGGWADRARTRPFDERTLAPVFSTTKALAALMIARLVGEGRLGYQTRVSELWPEFGCAGKAGVTVGQALSHQGGLAGLPGPMPATDWFDWDKICGRLAKMAPLWPPGSASGYHPVTFGYLAGEIFRRVDGRGLGEALRADVAGPLGLDLWIGLPDAEHRRVADVRRPPAPASLGAMTEIRRLAFAEPWSSPGGLGEAAQRRAAIPSVSGQATAAGLARIMAAFACDGMIGGARLLAPGAAAEASRQRIAGRDLVLPFDVSWGAGLLRNERIGVWGPNPETVGHAGWGGSCAFADPDRRLSGAYVMNRQSVHLVGDPRPRRLIEAAYAAL